MSPTEPREQGTPRRKKGRIITFEAATSARELVAARASASALPTARVMRHALSVSSPPTSSKDRLAIVATAIEPRSAGFVAFAIAACALGAACGRSSPSAAADPDEHPRARASATGSVTSTKNNGSDDGDPAAGKVLHAGVSDPAIVEPVATALTVHAAPTSCVKPPAHPPYIAPTISPRPMGGDMMMVIPQP